MVCPFWERGEDLAADAKCRPPEVTSLARFRKGERDTRGCRRRDGNSSWHETLSYLEISR